MRAAVDSEGVVHENARPCAAAKRFNLPRTRPVARTGRNRILRCAVDLAFAAVFVALMATATVQEALHEWLGMAAFALFAVHAALNRRWWSALLRGRYTALRTLNAATVLGSGACLVGLAVSCLVLSEHALGWMPALPGASWARVLHLLCSYWGFALALAHAGFCLHRLTGRTKRAPAARAFGVVCSIAVLCAGAWSFVQLDMGAYLLLRSQFIFIDPAIPLWLTAARYALVGSAVSCAANLIARALLRASRAQELEAGPVRQHPAQQPASQPVRAPTLRTRIGAPLQHASAQMAGIAAPETREPTHREKEGPMAIVQTAGRDQLGSFAPAFAHYNDDVLFGENWNDPGMDHKTRCLVTVIALMASGVTDSSLAYHLENARDAGIAQEEVAAAVTHAAFYAGWPKAWAVLRMAKDVWGGCDAPDDAPGISSDNGMAAYAASLPLPLGNPNDAFAAYFSGRSFLAPVSTAQVPVFNVTFEPACRNNWHVHHADRGGGQLLICVGGRGYCQVWGEAAVEMTPGTCVSIPANVKHWHGAAAHSWFSHLAVEIPGENARSEWLEPVSDEQYGALR